MTQESRRYIFKEGRREIFIGIRKGKIAGGGPQRWPLKKYKQKINTTRKERYIRQNMKGPYFKRGGDIRTARGGDFKCKEGGRNI